MNDQPISGVKTTPPTWTSSRWSLESAISRLAVPPPSPARPRPTSASRSDLMRAAPPPRRRRARPWARTRARRCARSARAESRPVAARGEHHRGRVAVAGDPRRDVEAVEVGELHVEQRRRRGAAGAPRRARRRRRRPRRRPRSPRPRAAARARARNPAWSSTTRTVLDMRRLSRSAGPLHIRITAPRAAAGRRARRLLAALERGLAAGTLAPSQINPSRSDHATDKHRRTRRPLERKAPARRDPRLDRIRRRQPRPSAAPSARKTLADEDLGNGESGKAEQILADAGFPEDASEQVLVQSRGGSRRRPRVQRRGRRRRSAARRGPARRRGLVAADGGQRRPDLGGRGLGARSISSSAATTIRPRSGSKRRLAAVAAAQEAHPELRIEQFGDASVEKAFDETSRRTSSGPRPSRCRSRW